MCIRDSVVSLLTFPLAVYEGYFREHKYGLLNQSFGPWMGELMISLAVSVVPVSYTHLDVYKRQVLGGIAAVLAILVVLFVYPGYMARSHQTTAAESAAAELTLRVEPSGTDLLLTWNKNSSAIANASHGVLSINDGDRHEDYDMDGNQLTTGTIMYTPVTGDVSFKMEVTRCV